MAARTRGFLGTVRRLVALLAGSAMLLTLAVLPAPGTARADAGNPILGTIHGSLQPNPDGTVTVFVRGQWNWLSDRKSTRLNSSHGYISYAVFCLKKKKQLTHQPYSRA